MVQYFQTLPEIGRSGLKVCTILKSTKLCRSMALLINMKLGKHLRQFGCSVHAPNMWETWSFAPRQFGWQFASNSRQFGSIFGTGVLCMPKNV